MDTNPKIFYLKRRFIMEEMNYTNNEVNVIDLEPEKVTMVTNVSEESGGSILGKAVVGVVFGIAALTGAYLYTTKNKREAKKNAKAIERLKKQGYNIEEPIVEEDNVVDVEAEVVESE
jgi:hypothetical protein